jgi:hypothetical protein
MKMKKAMTFYKDSVPDRATSENFLSPISGLVSSPNRPHRMAIGERELARLRGGLVDHFCMVLKMHLVLEINVAPRMGACNRLPVWMMAEVLPIEVQFQIAMTGEDHRRLGADSSSLPRQKIH